jgi:hypothetical protein
MPASTHAEGETIMPVHIPPQLPEASPIIISETPSHIVVAIEIAKTTLARHRRFIENLLAVTAPGRIENDE